MSKKISRRNSRIRNVLLIVSMMLVVAMASVGVTVAWLTDKTETITNTFTNSDVGITLTETQGTDNGVNGKSFKMVPGQPIGKDPKVQVLANSEECWVFVKLEESPNLDDFITYTVDSGWTQLPGVDGVYYREQDATGANPSNAYSVIAGDEVTVNGNVTKEMLTTNFTEPTLKVTAYAVQKAGSADAASAWAKLGNATVTPPGEDTDAGED